ncbi:MAG: DUF4331 family protein [Gemmatimonadaceae bacterium]
MKRIKLLSSLAAFGFAASVTVTGTMLASDHQDTPEVELNPRMDVNDVYAFPGASAGRIALVMTTSSPITPAQGATASFDPNLLYQLKVDNTGDAVEDLVFQITFEGMGASQRVTVRGPVRPGETGTRNSLVEDGPVVSGAINSSLGSATGTQVFAGLRDDPFFLDLEQFFRIIPDRKPVTGELARLPDTPSASAFRNPGIDYLAGINTLAIVIELPASQLAGSGGGRMGVWGTISR